MTHADRMDSTDGYLLVPLIQRSIFTRLDVGPFAILYTILISLDFAEENQQNESWHVLSHWIFPIVLSAHVAIFLLQQWNVFWRATVGYRKVSSTTSSLSHQWTHCLVQAPQMDVHEASHEAGIVPVSYQNIPSQTTTTSTSPESQNIPFKVAVVNFQDIIFRCCPCDQIDADVALWSQGGDSSRTSSDDNCTNRNNGKRESNCKLLFRRLVYPTQLPLSFFLNQWRGHASMSRIVTAKSVYGTNETPIQLPRFVELLQEQVVAPFFLFQVLCVILWSLDEYWYYGELERIILLKNSLN